MLAVILCESLFCLHWADVFFCDHHVVDEDVLIVWRCGLSAVVNVHPDLFDFQLVG